MCNESFMLKKPNFSILLVASIAPVTRRAYGTSGDRTNLRLLKKDSFSAHLYLTKSLSDGQNNSFLH